jgi:hypothetical protein
MNNLTYPAKPVVQMYNCKKISVAAVIIPLAAYSILFYDVPTASQARIANKHVLEPSHDKRNLSLRYDSLATNLEGQLQY